MQTSKKYDFLYCYAAVGFIWVSYKYLLSAWNTCQHSLRYCHAAHSHCNGYCSTAGKNREYSGAVFGNGAHLNLHVTHPVSTHSSLETRLPHRLWNPSAVRCAVEKPSRRSVQVHAQGSSSRGAKSWPLLLQQQPEQLSRNPKTLMKPIFFLTINVHMNPYLLRNSGDIRFPTQSSPHPRTSKWQRS